MSLLPKKKTAPDGTLEHQIILIYGPPKIGKSTFCSQMENPLFLATEPGLNALETYQVNVPDWSTFLKVCAELAPNGNQFKNLIIDTVDNLYKFCQEHVMAEFAAKSGRKDINHPDDMGKFGRGWGLVNQEFTRVLKKMSMLRYGLVLISHSKEKQIEEPAGTINKVIPSVSGGAGQFVIGLSDLILYFQPKKEDRFIRTVASREFEAGSRWAIEDNIPLSFDNFKKAWDNKKVKTTNKKGAK